jgi:hypothetical protein
MENKVPSFEEFMFAVNPSWWILVNFEFNKWEIATMYYTEACDIYI